MKTLKNTLFYCFIFFSTQSSLSQKVLRLDLTSIAPGEVFMQSENKNVFYDSVILVNAVPSKKYLVWIEKEVVFPDPIDVSGTLNDDYSKELSDLSLEFRTFVANILEDQSLTEIEIKAKIKPQLESEIKKIKSSLKTIRKNNDKIADESLKNKNKENLSKYESAMNKFIDSTYLLIDKKLALEVNVETGEIVKIYVQSGESKWTFILKGKQSGKWVTTYGFGFTSQRLESPAFHSKQIPDTNIFQILKSRRADYFDLNYVPAIFFSYFPSQNFNSCWNHSLSAGLGFGLNLSSAPIVFLGYNAMFYNNIGFSLGIAFHQQYRLKSQYDEFDILSSVLDKDQLHDKVYRPNLFFAINFRFGENPFKTGNASMAE